MGIVTIIMVMEKIAVTKTPRRLAIISNKPVNPGQ
jgi:hypothetical protein